MNNESDGMVLDAVEEALALILEEYVTLQYDELKQRYDDVIHKLRGAIEQLKTT